MKKHRIIATIIAALLLDLGRMIYLDNDLRRLHTDPAEVAAYMGASLVVFFLLFYVMDLIMEREPTDEIFFARSGQRLRFMPWTEGILVFFMNLTAFLAYFPGIFSYDIDYQTWQAAGILPLNDHHPVLHTLIWKGFYMLEQATGVRELGIVLYSLVQLTVVSLVAGWMVKKLMDFDAPAWMLFSIPVLTVLMPHLAVFSLIPTKDVYFGCALLCFALEVYDCLLRQDLNFDEKKGHRIRKREPWPEWRILLPGLLACLLRNNMLYVLLMFLVLGGILRYGRKLLLAAGTAAVMALLATRVIYPLAGVTPGPVQEAMSVPLQQMAAAYGQGEGVLTAKEMEQIREYLPEAGNYNPRFADPVKKSFSGDLYLQDKTAFWKLYLEVGKKMPGTYLTAFLSLNVDYWYLFAETKDPFADRAYIETGIYDLREYPLERNSLLPGVYEFLEKWASFRSTWMRRVPVFYVLVTPFAVLFLMAYVILKQKDRPGGGVLILYGGLLLTYLFGPVSNFRYVYPLFLAMPLIGLPLLRRIPGGHKE